MILEQKFGSFLCAFDDKVSFLLGSEKEGRRYARDIQENYGKKKRRK